MKIHEYQAKEILENYGVLFQRAESPGLQRKHERLPKGLEGRQSW
jgi:succinyl-CoA synthetase beta subunit